MTVYAQSYVVIGGVMLLVMFCAYIYLVWHDDAETRRCGYCMLSVGAVVCVAGLYMLYVCEVNPAELFRTPRNRYSMRSNSYHMTNLTIVMGIWVSAAYMGGKGLYKTLVNMGIWRDETEEEDAS